MSPARPRSGAPSSPSAGPLPSSGRTAPRAAGARARRRRGSRAPGLLAAAALLAAPVLAGCGAATADLSTVAGDDGPRYEKGWEREAEPAGAAAELADRCGDALPPGTAADPLTLADGLHAARFPARSPRTGTAPVLLLWSDAPGEPADLCGWGRFAAAAAERGVAALAVAPCGTGPGACTLPAAEQLGVAADYARRQMGAVSLVLVAPAGAAGDLGAAGAATGVDAWVTLQAPDQAQDQAQDQAESKDQAQDQDPASTTLAAAAAAPDASALVVAAGTPQELTATRGRLRLSSLGRDVLRFATGR